MTDFVIRESTPKEKKPILLDASCTGQVLHSRYKNKKLLILVESKEAGRSTVFFTGRNGLFFYYLLRDGDSVFIEGNTQDKRIKGVNLYMVGLSENELAARQEAAWRLFGEWKEANQNEIR